MIGIPILQDCFSTAVMRDIWSEEATIAAWLEAEKALALSQSALGLIPAEAAATIGRIDVSEIDRAALANDMMSVGRPIVGLVAQMRHLVGEHAPFVHFRSTTQDIMDTGMVLQMKRGLAEIRQRSEAHFGCVLVPRT